MHMCMYLYIYIYVCRVNKAGNIGPKLRERFR